jgi:hypothetical protein
MSIDPLAEKYTDWGVYVFSGNRVVDAMELEGLEPHSMHKTPDEAANNFAQEYNGLSIRANVEIRTFLYVTNDNNKNNFYSYTTPAVGSEGIAMGKPESIPAGGLKIGECHTHAADTNSEINNDLNSGDNFPSYQDMLKTYKSWKKNAKQREIYEYVVTPNGTLFKFIANDKVRNFEDNVSIVNTNVPSDPNSKTRKNDISPDKTPKVLPVNLNNDDYNKK